MTKIATCTVSSNTELILDILTHSQHPTMIIGRLQSSD